MIKGSSEVMKIFGSPTFQLKASSLQEAYSEMLRSFIKEVACNLKRGLQQSRALEQDSSNTGGVVMKSQKYCEEAKSAKAADL